MTHTRTLLLGAGLLCLGTFAVRSRRPVPAAPARPTPPSPPVRAAGAASSAVTRARLDIARMEAAGARVADLLRERKRRANWERPEVNTPHRPVTDVRVADDTHVRVRLTPARPTPGYEGGQAILSPAEARALRDALSTALEVDDLRRATAAAQAALDARLAR